MESGGKDPINEALKRLEAASNRLAESLYQKVGSAAGSGSGQGPGDATAPGGATSGSTGGERKEGDVIDAEYVDVDETKR